MKLVDPRHDPWRALEAEDGIPAAPPSPAPHRLLTLAQWQAARAHWPAACPVGVQLDNDADPLTLQPDLPRLALVALQFPKWTDGRAYSQAHLLRARLGFAGEIRATGEVLADMLPLLQRTGFDAAALRADQRPEVARRALGFFRAHYQGDLHAPGRLAAA